MQIPPPPQISSLTFNNANSFDVICLRVYVVREEFCSQIQVKTISQLKGAYSNSTQLQQFPNIYFYFVIYEKTWESLALKIASAFPEIYVEGVKFETCYGL